MTDRADVVQAWLEPRAEEMGALLERLVAVDTQNPPGRQLGRCGRVLRDAMAVDTLDACGIYFGTTGGQVYGSTDGGDSWKPIVHDLPAVLSVEVQTLP